MGTYISNVKAVQKSTVATHTIFAGPARIVGLYINKEPNICAEHCHFKRRLVQLLQSSQLGLLPIVTEMV